MAETFEHAAMIGEVMVARGATEREVADWDNYDIDRTQALGAGCTQQGCDEHVWSGK